MASESFNRNVLTAQQVAQGWRAHDGGHCPFGLKVAYQTMKRDGFVSPLLVNRVGKDWPWRLQGYRNQIIAYRTFTETNAGWWPISAFEGHMKRGRLIDCLVVWGQEVVTATWQPDATIPYEGKWVVGFDSDHPQIIEPSHFQLYPPLPWDVALD